MEKNTFFKKYWKVIVSFALIFAILGSAYLFIENYDPTEKPASETPAPLIPLLSLDASLITQVEIENTADSFSFIQSEGVWVLKNNPAAVLMKERVDSLVYSAATLSAVRTIVTEATDFTAYGLKEPQATVKLMQQNGAETVFHIGNITPAGDGYYVSLHGKNDVYMVATGTAGQFCTSLDAFRVMTLTDIPHTQIRTVSIKKDGTLLRLQYVAPPEGAYPGSVSTWKMESPLSSWASNTDVLKSVLSPLSSLVAAAVAEDNPSDFAKYGFKGDMVSVSTETQTVTFSVGNRDGVYFVMPEDKKIVYIMGGSLPFMEVSAFDLVEKETNLIPLDTVEKIELNLGSVAATLHVETEGENMKFFVGDTPAAEEKFKYLYMEIAGLSVDGIAKNPKAIGSPAASIVYTMVDGSTTTLSYYPYDSFNYALFENGECTFYIKKTRISSLAASLQKFIQNPNG